MVPLVHYMCGIKNYVEFTQNAQTVTVQREDIVRTDAVWDRKTLESRPLRQGALEASGLRFAFGVTRAHM